MVVPASLQFILIVYSYSPHHAKLQTPSTFYLVRIISDETKQQHGHNTTMQLMTEKKNLHKIIQG